MKNSMKATGIVLVLIFSILLDCKVEAACKHTVYTDIYTYTSYMNSNYKNYHYKIHHFKRVCEKCKKILKKEVSGNKKLSVHTFVNNQCTVCGYKKNSIENYTNKNNGSNINNYTVSQNIPKINYSFNESGNYIFVNNPEAIRDEYLLDIGHEWLYSTLVSGRTKVFLEHTAWHTNGVNYGIQIYNPNNYEVSIHFRKGAVAVNDWSYSTVWKRFENNNSGFSGITKSSPKMILPAYGSCWLFPDDKGGFTIRRTKGTLEETYSENYKNIKITSIIEALLEIYSSADVYMNFGAFKNFYNVNMSIVETYSANKDKFSDWDLDHDMNDSKVYSGIGYKYPLATTSLRWDIDDSVKGNLKVKLDDNSISDHWQTFNSHTAYNQNQVISSSIYPLNIPLRYNNWIYNGMIEKNAVDPRSGFVYNWADYGVTYKQNISITNYGTKFRNVTYRIFWDSPQNARTIISHDNNGTQKIFRTSNMNKTQEDIETVNIGAGKTVTFAVDITLGGMSNGTVSHAVAVN